MDGSRPPSEDTWTVAGRSFSSRLIVGTGKYKDYAQNAAAAEAAGAEIVTVALRRVNLVRPEPPMLEDYVDPNRFTFLPNTAGCFTGEDAVRTLRLAREAGGWNLVKLEVLARRPPSTPTWRRPSRALKLLIADGFEVMVYCADDPVDAQALEEAGAAAIMPLGAPIGSGLGIQNPAESPPDHRAVQGAGAGRRRRRHGLGRGSRHGDRLRRRADEHRHRRGRRPDPHGPGHEAGGRGRARRFLAGRMPRRMGADPSSPLTGLIR